MTCRQFPNLTFAPRKTCHLSGSNLSLHCYHATASVSYHMFPVIARDFSTFFADFSLENRSLFLTFLCRMTMSQKKHKIPEHKGADDRYPPANSCKNEVKSSRRAIFDIEEIFYFPNQIRFCYQKNANSKHAEHLQYFNHN